MLGNIGRGWGGWVRIGDVGKGVYKDVFLSWKRFEGVA
jgi:hypothetical protein